MRLASDSPMLASFAHEGGGQSPTHCRGVLPAIIDRAVREVRPERRTKRKAKKA